MKRHDRYPLKKKIKYLFDDFISRGFLAQVLLLAGTSFVLTLIFGAVVLNLGEPEYEEAYWTALMHMLDQGTITAEEKGTDGYFMFMLLVTFVGMAITGTITAIITATIQKKLNDLQKGHSAIAERDHVLILGFDGNTGTICREIIAGGELSGERVCLVVADDLPKEAMEQDLREFHGNPLLLPDRKGKKKEKLKALIRSGDLVSENTFSICAAENAKAILISRENDLETIRILLALSGYLKKNRAYIDDDEMPAVIATIHDRSNLSAARAAAGLSTGKGKVGRKKNELKVSILNDMETLGQYFAQTCVQQGFPYVLDALFNPNDTSIYIEKPGREKPEDNPFLGKTLPEIRDMVTNAIPLGFTRRKEGKPEHILLNPLETARFQAGDRLIYLAKGPELKTGERETAAPVAASAPIKEVERTRRNFLILGWSEALPDMLKNVSAYCTEDSSASIIDPENRAEPESRIRCRHIDCGELQTWEDLERVLDENSCWFDEADSRRLTNIVILSKDWEDRVLADEIVMVVLLNMRQYLKDRGITDICITSEMHLPQDQMLLLNSSISDFVVASEISNHMMTQLIDDPAKYVIIKNLLRPESDIIRLNPLTDYIDVEKEFNFEGVFRAAVARGEIFGRTEIPLGWIRLGSETDDAEESGTAGSELVLNPTKEKLEQLYPGGSCSSYRLVVLSGLGYFSTLPEEDN